MTSLALINLASDLADMDPRRPWPDLASDTQECMFCGVTDETTLADEAARRPRRVLLDLSRHANSCVWKRAKEMTR